MRFRQPATAQVIGAFLAGRADLSPNTLARYRYTLGRLQEAHERLPRTALPLEQLIAALPVSPLTRDAHWRDYRALYNWAAPRLGVKNPMALVRRPHRPKTERPTLTNDQLEQLLARPMSRRDRALVAVLLDTGIRVGELAGLTWRDLRTDHLNVRGKTGARTVPLSASTARLLIGIGDREHVWTGRQGPLTSDGIAHIVRGHLTAVGVNRGPHTLRHTVGQQWLRNGGDLRSLQLLLGHENIATTAIYAALNQQDLQDKHAQYSPIAQLAKEA